MELPDAIHGGMSMQDVHADDLEAAAEAAARCQWFLLCEGAATTTEAHPTLGAVPICAKCAARVARWSVARD
jgi:hypothetical protein